MNDCKLSTSSKPSRALLLLMCCSERVRSGEEWADDSAGHRADRPGLSSHELSEDRTLRPRLHSRRRDVQQRWTPACTLSTHACKARSEAQHLLRD